MRARTTTVLGLILLLAAAPVHAAPSVPPPPAALRVFVGTTSLRSPVHRSLVAKSSPQLTPAAATAQSRAFLAALLPLFGPDLGLAFGDSAVVATYVSAGVLRSLRPMAIGNGESLAWSPYGAPPGRDILDLLLARQTVPALVPGDDGLHPADLKFRADGTCGEGGVFVTDINLRGRNALGDDVLIEPPALAVVGLGLVCIAPAPRRLRVNSRLQPMRRLRFHRR
jgi:hypothetical protein